MSYNFDNFNVLSKKINSIDYNTYNLNLLNDILSDFKLICFKLIPLMFLILLISLAFNFLKDI